jgi:hypothetical protein
MGMGNGMGDAGMGTDTTAPPATTTDNNGGTGNGNAGCDPTATDTADPSATDTAAPTDTNAGNGTDAGTAANQVCKGSTVTTSGQKGVSASSNQFPAGTMLKVTNLDNGKSITVPVTSTSGSCVLLDNDAFVKIHENGKQLIRKALIQKIG